MPNFPEAMLKTSYFARSAREPGAVSIARFPPKWFPGSRYLKLAPKPEMLKIGDWEEYRRGYREEVLMGLDPDEVLRDLNIEGADHDIILLCFEKDRTHCHRGLVAEWFHETKGISVPELWADSCVQSTF
ncbi:DUF488 domain-containing protein [Methanoregula sp.]|jgi:hypothetical protein|uniref:DUF488 domain-containing protein n=1 Tax=Methanoregula sp. TaxID=2052170 RepID=UPI003C181580